MRIAAIALFALALSGCGWSYRFKLTFYVQVEHELHSSSGVFQVSVKEQTQLLSGIRYVRDLRGEALAVDLGKRGVLFATLTMGRSDNIALLPLLVFQRVGLVPRDEQLSLGADRFAIQTDALSKLRARTDLLVPQEVPLLVRFRDVRDPKTAERVRADDLSDAFGEGVRLARVTIEMTDEPVTTGIEKWPVAGGATRQSCEESTL